MMDKIWDLLNVRARFQHIKEDHPDIWREYMKRGDKS